MGSINIDAELIKKDVHFNQVEEKFIEITNGCICCTLREDLLVEITKLCKEDKYDYLLIESTGISEPLQVAETFTFDLEEEKNLPKLKEYARLDTCITVIDGFNFFQNLKSIKEVKQKNNFDESNISNLLIDQIEFSDVILINKIDLIKKEELEEIKKIILILNPECKVYETLHSKIELKNILNTNLFSFEKAEKQPGWLKILREEIKNQPETLEYGISSFVYKRRRPFHPERLYDLIHQKKNNYLKEKFFRSKGFFWLATRNDMSGHWEQAGQIFRFNPSGKWFSEYTKEDWQNFDKERKKEILKEFEGDFGDKRQQLVFIGNKFDRETTEKLLDSCLLSDDEMKQDWSDFIDNFEDWDDEEEEEEEHDQ